MKKKLKVLKAAFNLYGELTENTKIFMKANLRMIKMVLKAKIQLQKLKNLDYQSGEPKTESLSDEDKSDINQPTQLNQLNPKEMSKPIWIEVSRKDFISLIKDVADNLDKKDYKITVNNADYNLENAEKYSLEIITKKISKNEALELYKYFNDSK